MTILVSAIEVGSVRSLIPVCIELLKNKKMVLIEKKGFFDTDQMDKIASSLVDIPQDEDGIRSFMMEMSIDVVLFSVNIRDTRPLMIARIAKDMGIRTVHLLDYWNGYRDRMELDGQEMFVPSKYLVPDEYAREKAIEEGICSDLIKVVGQPAFTDTKFNYIEKKQQNNPIGKFSKKGRKIILFVSEPVSNDQGSSIRENRRFRGYTEKHALTILIKSLNNNNNFFVIVLPHPRQNIKELKLIWQSLNGDSLGCVLSNVRGRDLLPFVVGVSGMASTLLYEAWLVGVPVLSIQPELLHDSYRMLQGKSNITFIDKNEFSIQTTEKWLKSLSHITENIFQPDLHIHSNASKTTIEELTS